MGTQTSYLTSSGSMLSGIPASVSYYENFGKRITGVLTKIVHEEAKRYEASVRNKARASWGDLADHIQVTVGPDLRLIFSIEEGFEDMATELEYGTPNTSPSAVLRMAAIDANNELSSTITNRVAKEMS